MKINKNNFFHLVFLSIFVFFLIPGSTYAVRGAAVTNLVATSKGPNQINLTWSDVGDPGIYGYIIEIQSDTDSRYSSFTEIQPIPTATGYTCTPSASYLGTTGCTTSDPGGIHVYNPIVKGVPYWVTESQYIDPQDGTPAQFIASGLKNNTQYRFRVRTYMGNTSPVYGTYSPTAVATTANYTQRFVSVVGNDANDGTASDSAHAWRTIRRASNGISCGQLLVIMGGVYTFDSLAMNGNCSPAAKQVIMVNPGDTATITSQSPDLINNGYMMALWGSYEVVDGLSVTSWNGGGISGNYDWRIGGDHNALLGISSGPSVIPTSYGGINFVGSNNLLYGSYIHDYGSPDANQNPNGQGGFLIHVGSPNNVLWSNHLTRGGHDGTLCNGGCLNNKFLNNVYDGGWGMAFEAVYDGANNNLIEGAISKSAGKLEYGIYKPAIELSSGHNTLRRGIFSGYGLRGLEISSYGSPINSNSNLIYNNVFYNGQRGYFQSHNGGISAYDGVLVQNNIFMNFTENATEIYLSNMTPNAIAYNTFLKSGGNGSSGIFVWNQDSGGAFSYPQTLAYAESNYAPAVANNVGLDVDPQFVDPANMDFHLSPTSPVRGRGVWVADGLWPFPLPRGNSIDLGPYFSLGATAPPVVPPVVPPAPIPLVISAIQPVVPTQDTAQISWTTNQNSDSQVEYGTTAGYGNSTPISTTLLTSHSITLSSLASGTVFHFRVKSRDNSGTLVTSSDQVFTTTAVVIPDPLIPPVVIVPPVVVTPPPVVPPPPVISTPAATGPLSLTLLGNNPAYLTVNSTFSDPGILIGGGTDSLFPITSTVNGKDVGRMENISLDTRVPTTYTIVHTITDASGQKSTVTRTVIVNRTGAPEPLSSVTPPNTSTTVPILKRTLYIGMKGSDVMDLQRYLKAKGFFTYPSVTDYFGGVTRLAVARYQCAQNIVCSGSESTTGYGMVGVKTRTAINSGK